MKVRIEGMAMTYGPPSRLSWYVCPTCAKAGTTKNFGHRNQLTGMKCIDQQVEYVYVLQGKAEELNGGTDAEEG